MKVLNCNWVNLGPEIFEEKLPPPTHSRLNPAILTTFSSDEKCMSCVLLPTPAGAADIVYLHQGHPPLNCERKG